MSWNYRVCHRPSVVGGGFQIHEVYYEEDGSIKYYSVNPVTAHGDITEELYEDMCMMMDAFDKDPINLDHQDYLFKKQEKVKKREG